MRSSFRRVATSLVATSLVVVLSGCAVSDEPTPSTLGLVSRLEVVNDTLGKDDRVTVHWTLSNEGPAALSVPRWQVPGASLDADLFAVVRDGEPVAYAGKIVKRAAPGPADLVTIAPGASLATDLELSAFYPMGKAGTYAIEQHGLPQSALASDARFEELRSNRVDAIRVEDGADATFVPPAASASLVASSYQGCTSSEKTKIASALGQAQTYAVNARTYLQNGSHGSRYTTWFGSYQSTRFSTVTTHYNKIAAAIQNQSISFDCGCNDDYYAYVYANQPYTIYLCNAFWSAPTAGTDSKAGTIVHEMSHFNVTAGTDDWQYGQSGCKSLAQSQPSRAIDNADSHEYFAENSPSLP